MTAPLFKNVRTARGSQPLHGSVPGFVILSHSVGVNGGNGSKDVFALQEALNAVHPSFAGPAVPLAVDGLVGPKTIHAIKAIQAAWTRVQDGRADPDGPTVKVLNRLAGLMPPSQSVPKTFATTSTPTPPSPEVLAALRRIELAQTQLMPMVVGAAVGAANMLGLAQRHIAAVAGGLHPAGAALRTRERLAFLFVAKHFRLSESDPGASLAAAQQVTVCFARMIAMISSRTVTVGGRPRFDRMYALPTVPKHMTSLTDIAYVGRASGALQPGVPDGYSVPNQNGQGEMPEVCDGVYLLPAFDTLTQKTSALLHELVHLSGGAGPTSMIIDMNGFLASDAAFDGQSRDQRLQNVICYEFLASELLFGSAAIRSVVYPSNFPTAWSTRLPMVDWNAGGITAPAAAPGSVDPLAFPGGFT